MEAYNIEKNWDEFSAAQAFFFEMVTSLKSAVMLHAEHSYVEKMLSVAGAELLRKLFQANLDRRSQEEEIRESVSLKDGTALTHRRLNCTRKLETLFGEVTVTRKGYSLRGQPSLFPMDAELNLPPDRYSHELRNVVGIESSKDSFDDTVSLVSRVTAGSVPKRQAEELTPKMACDFDAYYEHRLAAEEHPVLSRSDLLVMSVDGKGVVMREDSLREATRKNAQKAKASKRKQARLSPGEKGNRKRNATVAAVYTVSPFRRTPQQILHREEEEPQTPKRPRPQHKRVWASVEKPMEDVIDTMFQEAQQRDPHHHHQWVVLLDGAPYQLECVKRIARKYREDVTFTVDFVHAAEYVWKAAYSFFDVGSEDAERWVNEKLLELLKGKAGLVAAAIGRKATRLDLDDTQRKNADKCIDYLKNLKAQMRYDVSLENGYPIATGVIEGACRYLVKDRMDITGARWGLERAEAILKLRSLYTSGDFNEYMKFHFQKEKQRNYPEFSPRKISLRRVK